MNHDEAQFILRTYRSDGRYRSGDPLFADALAAAQRDAGLSEWFAREQALDEVVANKLDAVQPPAGLREAIVVGARASRRPAAWWQQPWKLAAAIALIAVPLSIALVLSRAPAFGAADLAQFAVDELATGRHQHFETPAVTALAQQFAHTVHPMPTDVAIDADLLHRTGCRSIQFAGREIFEICFERTGTRYHLYVARGSRAQSPDAPPTFVTRGEFAAASWSRAGNLYTLVTHGGVEALRRVL